MFDRFAYSSNLYHDRSGNTNVCGFDFYVMAQWLGCRTRNHKVASSSPVTAMSSFGDWFTHP